MQALCPRPDEHAPIRSDLNAIFVSLELSRSTWVITSLAPGGGEKMSRHSVPSGDIAALLARLSQLKEKARARTGQVFPIIVIQEAGLDGFWIHRVLQKEGIKSHVVDPASIATSRRRRRAKTDRIDGEALVRALLAYKRGEPRVCAMVKAPTPQEEDRRRISRERETLTAERVQHVNRIKGLLFAQGIGDYEPLHRNRRERLQALIKGRWSPPPGGPEAPDQTGARPARAPDRTGQGCRSRAGCRTGPGAGEPRRASASGPIAGPARHWTRGGRHALVGRLVPHVQQPKAGCRLCRAGPHAMAKRIGPSGPRRLQGRQSPAAHDHDPDCLAVAAASAAVSADRVVPRADQAHGRPSRQGGDRRPGAQAAGRALGVCNSWRSDGGSCPQARLSRLLPPFPQSPGT